MGCKIKMGVLRRMFRLAVVTCLLFIACDDSNDASFQIYTANFDFSDGDEGWTGDFCGYAEDVPDSTFQWTFSHTQLPAESGSTSGALLLSAVSPSQSIFMFMKKKITGFRPNTDYTVVFDVQFITDIRGQQQIEVKAGASTIEPKKVVDDGQFVLNIDQGPAYEDGENLAYLGTVADAGNNYYAYNTYKFSNNINKPFTVRSNSKGEIWMILGSNSLYDQLCAIYYTNVNIVFSTSDL